MPKQFMIELTFEFIQIAKTMMNPKLLASRDVESLLTNVPVLETIQITLENVYNHLSIKPPNVPQKILEELLIICTT